MTSYRARVGETLEVLAEGLAPYVDRKMRAHMPRDEEWILTAAEKLGKRQNVVVSVSDPQFQLEVLSRFWGPVFAADLPSSARDVVGELLVARNHWAHISEETPIDLDFAEGVNRLAAELLESVRSPLAERIRELDQALGWQSVQDRAQADGVDPDEAVLAQLREMRAERAALETQLAQAREEAALQSDRSAATARRLADLQSQYAAVADLGKRYAALQQQLKTQRVPEGAPSGQLDDEMAEAEGAVANLQDEASNLRQELAAARLALDGLDPLGTPAGQRWAWLVAALLVTMGVLMLAVTATLPN